MTNWGGAVWTAPPLFVVTARSSTAARPSGISFYEDLESGVGERVNWATAYNNAHSTGWIDPNGATDYQGVQPGGTITFYDALGRAFALQDPSFGTSQEPGIPCSTYNPGTSYTAFTNFGLGTVSGDSNTYVTITTVDPNQHVTVTYQDALGRTIYTQQDIGTFRGTLTPTQQTAIQYNALSEPTQVQMTDLVPQSGQSLTSVTTTASYDDLGRLTTLSDPDRSTHS